MTPVSSSSYLGWTPRLLASAVVHPGRIDPIVAASALVPAGVAVTVLTPGAADLAAMGGNLMNPRRRARVLDTSLETSAAALATGTGAAAA